jgi:prepilin-type N-terminal cleavage/methylation domain-containing protein
MTDRRLVGFTIVELLIALSIIGILASIGSTVYVGQIKKARTNVVIADIKAISLDIDVFTADNSGPPDDLSSVRHDMKRDPWGNSYQYLKIAGEEKSPDRRKDRFIVPINSDMTFTAWDRTAKASRHLRRQKAKMI